MLNSALSNYAACFVRKVCGLLWSILGAPVGEGKSGVKVKILNTKVGLQARVGQTPPHTGGSACGSAPLLCCMSWKH